MAGAPWHIWHSHLLLRETHTHTQTKRQTGVQPRQTDRETERETERETGVQIGRVNHNIVHSQRRKEERRFHYFVYSLLWRRKGTEGMND